MPVCGILPSGGIRRNGGIVLPPRAFPPNPCTENTENSPMPSRMVRVYWDIVNVLLVDPPFQRFMGFYRYYYPLGLAYIAAVLNRSGHTTRIYDAEHSAEARSLTWFEASGNYQAYLDALEDVHSPEWSEFTDLVDQLRPEVVGISVLSVKLRSALLLARLCKSFDSTITVVVGADHATAAPQELLLSGDIDYAVRGEGEQTMLELVECLDRGGDPGCVEGISYVKDGSVVHNGSRRPIRDLDSLPFPALESLTDLSTYRPIDLGVVMTSRGCPYSCSYCGVATVWGRETRFRSVDNVIAEIAMLKERYGVGYVSFRDGSFTLDRRRVLRLCDRLIESGLTRCDLLDGEVIDAMKRSGCAAVRVGIESGSERLQREMRRSTSLARIREAARLLHEHGMHWTAYFMFGVPGETRDTIEDSLRLIQEINPCFVTVARYSPIPGTEMCGELQRTGLISEDVDWALESNQSLYAGYSKHIDRAEFAELMKRVGEFVNRHNESNAGASSLDRRFKTT